MTNKKITKLLLITIVILLSLSFLIFRVNNKAITIGIFTGSTWDVPNPDSYVVIDNAIETFKEQYPNVVIEYISGIQEDDYSSWLAEQFVLGKEPDLFMILPDDFEYLSSIGALANLDDLKYNDNDFDLNKYYKSAINSGVYNNIIYGIPYLCNPTLMFVNTTLLEKENIKIPDSDWTIDDFFNICKTVSNSGDCFGCYNYSWLNLLNAKGIHLLSENGYRLNFNTELMNDVFSYIKKLNSLNGPYLVSAKDFDEGKVAFYPLSYAQYRTYKSYPYQVQKYSNFSWGCLNMPGEKDAPAIAENSSILLGISSRSKHKTLAWKLLKHLAYNENTQTDLVKHSQGVSPLKDVTSSVEIAEFINSSAPSTIVDIELLNLVMDNEYSQRVFKNSQEVISLIDNECDSLIKNNDNDVLIFANNLQKKVKLLLNE